MEGQLIERLRQAMNHLEQATEQHEQATLRLGQARGLHAEAVEPFEQASRDYLQAVELYLMQPTEKHRQAVTPTRWSVRQLNEQLQQATMNQFRKAAKQR